MLCYNTDSKLDEQLSITSIMSILITLNCSLGSSFN